MPRSTLPCLAQQCAKRLNLRQMWLCAALLCAPMAQADTTKQLWSVHAFGLKVGEVTLNVDSDAQRYQGSGSFRTTGLVSILRDIRFSVSGQGTEAANSLKPQRYEGHINTGKRISETSLTAQNGLLIKTKGTQNPATPIAPEATKDALDPMSMMWRILRDQSSATLCQVDQTQFDGTRLVRITLTTRRTEGAGKDTRVTCSGTYDRIGGYSAEELAELTTSPLSVTYQPAGDLWRAQEVRLSSRHGKAKLLRRK